ncbi:hypothetical protein TNCV_2393821 [Trichonephila clavipes]|nr:hypothetical protein TNCV_2393821 [Trichonephila clavipes]
MVSGLEPKTQRAKVEHDFVIISIRLIAAGVSVYYSNNSIKQHEGKLVRELVILNYGQGTSPIWHPISEPHHACGRTLILEGVID